MDKQIDSRKNLTINGAKYYRTNTVTASDAQHNLTCKTETVTRASNGNFEQTLLSYRTIPFLPLPTNPDIDQGIADIILTTQTLLLLWTNEIVIDVSSGDA